MKIVDCGNKHDILASSICLFFLRVEQSYLISYSIDTLDTSIFDDVVYIQEFLKSIKVYGLSNHNL